jgi:hypothetical protein
MGRSGIFGGRFPRGGGRSEQKNEAAEEFLQKLSDTTAGRFYSGEVTDLTKTLGTIVEELRYQYRLGFYPADEKNESIRQLKVKVACPDTIVRARSSYRVQSKSESNNP